MMATENSVCELNNEAMDEGKAENLIYFTALLKKNGREFLCKCELGSDSSSPCAIVKYVKHRGYRKLGFYVNLSLDTTGPVNLPGEYYVQNASTAYCDPFEHYNTNVIGPTYTDGTPFCYYYAKNTKDKTTIQKYVSFTQNLTEIIPDAYCTIEGNIKGKIKCRSASQVTWGTNYAWKRVDEDSRKWLKQRVESENKAHDKTLPQTQTPDAPARSLKKAESEEQLAKRLWTNVAIGSVATIIILAGILTCFCCKKRRQPRIKSYPNYYIRGENQIYDM